MLQAIGLSKSYNGVRALDSLDLLIEPGQIFCLLGANGAGKTTTINLFLNFIEASEGQALVDGMDVAEHPLVTKKRLAYIPEQVMLYRNLSGLENVEYFTALAGRGETSRDRLRQLLADCGLPQGAIDQRISGYSKGMRQKVGIAIAVAKQAKALLLDEPTSGLDPKASNEFSELLERLRGEGVAVLMATHDLFRATETGTHIGIMKQGRLVERLAAEEIGHADLERLCLDHMRG